MIRGVRQVCADVIVMFNLNLLDPYHTKYEKKKKKKMKNQHSKSMSKLN